MVLAVGTPDRATPEKDRADRPAQPVNRGKGNKSAKIQLYRKSPFRLFFVREIIWGYCVASRNHNRTQLQSGYSNRENPCSFTIWIRLFYWRGVSL